MWPDVQNNSIANLTFFANVNGQRVMNSFGYQCTLTGGVQPADSVTQAFFAALAYGDLEDAWRACVGTDVTLSEAWFQILFPARIRKTVLERNLAGTYPSTTNRQNTQACISRHGVTAARHANGGIHLVLPDNGAMDTVATDGLLTAAYKTILQTLATQMLSAVNTVVGGSTYNWAPGIINPDPQNPVILSFTKIVQTNVQDEARTMSRRTVGRGI